MRKKVDYGICPEKKVDEDAICPINVMSFSIINVKNPQKITKKQVIKGGLPEFRCYF